MLFAIHAYESTYCGLHGVEDFAIVECKNKEEATEIACEMSRDVIHSYSSIEDNIYQEAAFILGYEYDEMLERLAAGEEIDGYDEACDDAETEMICFELYELDENCGMSIDYLNSLDFDEVVDRYCKKI
jgi:hypothetical protein